MREEYVKDKCNFLPRESEELRLTFPVDGVKFTYKVYDGRAPGKFKGNRKG